MNWICIGLLAGSLVTSLHDNKEACEGRAVTLRESKAVVKCVEMPGNITGYTTSTLHLMARQCQRHDVLQLMLRPLRSTRRRKPKRREVSRSFRIPPDVDRELEKAAREERWSKSFLIRDILVGWLTFRRAKESIADIEHIKAAVAAGEKHDDEG